MTGASSTSRNAPSLPVTIPTTALSSTATGASVLVIDDDQDIRAILREILDGEGYIVVTAGNGVEALEVLKSAKPSLILLDLNMPVMDGFEFRRLQRLDPVVAHIPTVVMSALHRMRERIADLGVQDVLEKPVALERLLQVVSQHCGSGSAA